jgi:hypothetical protein
MGLKFELQDWEVKLIFEKMIHLKKYEEPAVVVEEPVIEEEYKSSNHDNGKWGGTSVHDEPTPEPKWNNEPTSVVEQDTKWNVEPEVSDNKWNVEPTVDTKWNDEPAPLVHDPKWDDAPVVEPIHDTKWNDEPTEVVEPKWSVEPTHEDSKWNDVDSVHDSKWNDEPTHTGVDTKWNDEPTHTTQWDDDPLETKWNTEPTPVVDTKWNDEPVMDLPISSTFQDDNVPDISLGLSLENEKTIDLTIKKEFDWDSL